MSDNNFRPTAEFLSVQSENGNSPTPALQILDVSGTSQQQNILVNPETLNLQVANVQLNVSPGPGDISPLPTMFAQAHGDGVFGHLDPKRSSAWIHLWLRCPRLALWVRLQPDYRASRIYNYQHIWNQTWLTIFWDDRHLYLHLTIHLHHKLL